MRPWNEFVAAWGDVIPLGLTALGLLLLAALVGLLWYTWPAWSPARWRMPARRAGKAKRAKVKGTVSEAELAAVAASDEELPAVAPEVFATLADRLAAQGRYAEAVRERLRAMVRELVDRSIVQHHPGWTVTELARAAGSARPVVAPPLTAATEVFSDIWYGERPAQSVHDEQMKVYLTAMQDAVALTEAHR